MLTAVRAGFGPPLLLLALAVGCGGGRPTASTTTEQKEPILSAVRVQQAFRDAAFIVREAAA
jgi:hypothetical protein